MKLPRTAKALARYLQACDASFQPNPIAVQVVKAPSRVLASISTLWAERMEMLGPPQYFENLIIEIPTCGDANRWVGMQYVARHDEEIEEFIRCAVQAWSITSPRKRASKNDHKEQAALWALKLIEYLQPDSKGWIRPEILNPECPNEVTASQIPCLWLASAHLLSQEPVRHPPKTRNRQPSKEISEKEAEALWLMMEHQNVSKVARILGRDESTIRKRLKRAYSKDPTLLRQKYMTRSRPATLGETVVDANDRSHPNTGRARLRAGSITKRKF